MIRDRIESMSDEGEGDEEYPITPLRDVNHPRRTGDKKNTGEGNGVIGDGESPTSNISGNGPRLEAMEIQESPPNKKSTGCSRCVNTNLLGLKILLFVFYGGLGVISTWLNHSFLSRRFTEKETALAYGLASLLSIVIPIIFGFVSDKSAKPKKVLAISLFLTGLIYPLVIFVPSSVSYHYKEKLDWCRSTGRNESSCLPFVVNCSATEAELIINYGQCSESCGGKLIINNCQHQCDPYKTDGSKGEVGPDYDLVGPRAEAQIRDELARDLEGIDEDEVDLSEAPPPHICIRSNSKKYPNLCKVYDKEMKDIILNVKGITGYTEIHGDDQCHYPLYGYLDGKDTPQSLMSCPQLSGTNCYVTCSLHWDMEEVDQWVCQDDYLQWLVSFTLFVLVHGVGTMLLLSAAGLVNSAVVSMVHEHEHGIYPGCQLTYGALGFAILTPTTALLFYYLHTEWEDPLPWDLEYIIAFSIWFILSGIIACTLSYEAEWVPKPGTVRPMLTKWCLRGQNLLFFDVIITLGCFQGMLDILAYYQIKNVGGSLLIIGLTAAATVIPALLFICRIERVIEYCGGHNLLSIGLVVFSLQFTGYAYLVDVAPEWSFLLKALDTFSILMVWITASLTTHNLAPRSLVATCQTIIVILYAGIGRGIGGVLAYFGLLYISKEYLLKTCGVLAILLCILFLLIHYWCLKPAAPYSKRFNTEKPASQGNTGNYKPLKLVGKNDRGEDPTEEL